MNQREFWIERNRKRSEALGMSWSAADRRLRRILLWKAISKLGTTDCYRCGTPMSEDTFSIDHIVDWGTESSLFFDPDNVSFSHLRCNSEASYAKIRIIDPDGLHWCADHKAFLPVSEFQRHSSTRSGLQSKCRSCKSTRTVAMTRRARDRSRSKGEPIKY